MKRPLIIIAGALLLPLLILGFLAIWIKQPVFFSSNLNIDATNIAKANPERMRADVQKLAVEYAHRNFWEIKTLNLAADYIEVEFKKTTARVETQQFKVDSESFHNVIAHFGPQIDMTASYENGPPKPIIIGAHYDAHEATMGADDNASGVAGLLELARLLEKNQPSVPVQLVAYTLEEPPNFRTDSMGSRQHAKQLLAAGVRPKLVLVLEAIGFYSDHENTQSYPVGLLEWLYPTTANFISVVGQSTDASITKKVKMLMQSAANPLHVESINAPATLVGIDFSDHASYWPYQIPALMITDTAFFRSPHYHQPTDTPNTLDYERMAKVIDGVNIVIKHEGYF